MLLVLLFGRLGLVSRNVSSPFVTEATLSTTSSPPIETPVASAAPTTLAGKYLTFGLGHEEYGLEILKVREIMGLMEITAIPRVPSYVRGVVNIRGQVISVVDLRAKFGMPETANTDQTCIIVVETQLAHRKISTGLIVDRVSEVLDIPADAIENPPEMYSHTATEFILGIGKVGPTVKFLLDINQVLNHQEILQLAHELATPETH